VSTAPAGVPIYSSFCPDLTTASQARHFGVQFILAPAGTAGPAGAMFDRRIGDEDLYGVPDSGPAVLLPGATGGRTEPDDDRGTPLTVEHPTPSSWRLITDSPTDQTLRLRLTDLPGWHASMDGAPLALQPASGVMLQAHLPPGHHVIELHYWPELFTVGLLVAALALAGLIALSVGARLTGGTVPAATGAGNRASGASSPTRAVRGEFRHP
jgi:hypothetical protein